MVTRFILTLIILITVKINLPTLISKLTEESPCHSFLFGGGGVVQGLFHVQKSEKAPFDIIKVFCVPG
jgi:hypothetical protein